MPLGRPRETDFQGCPSTLRLLWQEPLQRHKGNAEPHVGQPAIPLGSLAPCEDDSSGQPPVIPATPCWPEPVTACLDPSEGGSDRQTGRGRAARHVGSMLQAQGQGLTPGPRSSTQLPGVLRALPGKFPPGLESHWQETNSLPVPGSSEPSSAELERRKEAREPDNWKEADAGTRLGFWISGQLTLAVVFPSYRQPSILSP